MNKFKKTIIFILIQVFFITNICFAQDIGLRQASDTLSPRVMIATDILINLFASNEKPVNGLTLRVLKDYNPDVLVLKNGKLSIAGRVLVELRLIIHELNSYLVPVIGMPITSAEKAAIDPNDLKEIQGMVENLKLFQRTVMNGFEWQKMPSLENLSDIIMQVNGLRLKYRDLKALQAKGTLSENYSYGLQHGIFSIDFIIEHVNVIMFGAKEIDFDIKDLFEKENTHKILDVQNLTNSGIFGYRSGLEFVIKNLRNNVMPHSGGVDYNVKISDDEKNISIIFSDTGKGFNIENLRQKAVERKIFTPENALKATKKQLIDLIFAEGFSRRAEDGKAHGLGLFLCRQIIEIYFKGKIIAENAQEHSGAVFKITIPKIRERGFIENLKQAQSLKLKVAAIFSVPIAFFAIHHHSQFVTEAKNGAIVIIKQTGSIPINPALGKLLNQPTPSDLVDKTIHSFQSEGQLIDQAI